MATINYNGMELEEYRPDNPETYEPPKKMLVWSDGLKDSAVLAKVLYVNPIYIFVSVLQDNGHIAVFDHCALIHETPASRMATWFELAKWCATGNGLVLDTLTERIDTGVMFKVNNHNDPVDDKIKVRKWDDTEWHTPDVEYMGIDE